MSDEKKDEITVEKTLEARLQDRLDEVESRLSEDGSRFLRDRLAELRLYAHSAEEPSEKELKECQEAPETPEGFVVSAKDVDND